jgi:hypothetical protein
MCRSFLSRLPCEPGEIQQKAHSRALMDDGPLDEVLKSRRAI